MAYDPANLPELVPLDLVVPDVIGPGLTLFVGMPHAFKSYMAVDLAYCVATGENFLGTFNCRQGHVLYAALEDGRSRIAARRQEMQIDFPPGGATFLEQDDFFKDGTELAPEGKAAVLRSYVEEKQPALVIIDTLARLFPKVGEGVRLLNALAKNYHVPVLAVDHPLKIGSSKRHGVSIREVKGAYSEVAGSADGFLGLTRHDLDFKGVLNIDHKDLPSRSLALDMDQSVMRWRISQEDPVASLRQEYQDIISYLQQHPHSSPSQIGEALRIEVASTLRTRLHSLEREDLVYGYGNTTARRYIAGRAPRTNMHEVCGWPEPVSPWRGNPMAGEEADGREHDPNAGRGTDSGED
jgi:hypothetical protein